MRQTLAIFHDAYRELNSRKLFWIALSLSLAVVVALALPSNNDRGIGIFGMTLDFPMFSTRAISPKGFYTQLFSIIGINIWLTWGATILALISTAGMIPDMISGGSIDMLLCRPIGRLRLFLTKYAAGLLFVGLQVSMFILGAFLVIGVRGHAWRPNVFIAIPIVLAFYSYLFCVCVLIGMITRSTMAAVLGTAIVWLFFFAIGTTESALMQQRVGTEAELRSNQAQVEAMNRAIETVDKQLESLRATSPEVFAPPAPSAGTTATAPAGREPTVPQSSDASSAPASAARGADEPARRRGGMIADAIRRRRMSDVTASLKQLMADVNDPEALRRRRADQVSQRDRLLADAPALSDSAATITKWHRGFYLGKTFLPKTADTTELFTRYTIDPSDREGFFAMMETQQRFVDSHAKEVDEAQRSRSVWWIVGTSLGFEAVVLGIAACIFCRRDF